MKSPLRKLKKLGRHKSEPEENLLQFFSSHTDGLNQAAKDLEDMKASYDALVSAAAATVNSAYEFSESLQEMGNSLLEKNVVHDDGETGEALLLLGRVQVELQKLSDGYRSQIISSVSNPSESFLMELRKVEEMKLQCDEKRELFEHIVGQLKEKGKTRHGKLEAHTSDQLKAVHEEYDETARLCIFRVQSLKKGQCRSLLTLAAHHHAAQLKFFRKGLLSLETVDTHIRSVAESQRIDYQLSTEECDDGRYSVEAHGDGLLSFKYNMNKETEEEMSRRRNEAHASVGKAVSHSAPLYSEKFDPAERLREMRPFTQKSNTHVLPTPDDAKGLSVSSISLSSTMLARGGSSKNLWHSSPLDVSMQKKTINETLPSHNIPKSHLSTEENSNNKHILPLPPRLTEAVSGAQVDSHTVYDGHKIKRQAFSGPLGGKSLSSKPLVAASGPISSNEIIGSLGRASGPQPLLSASMSHSAPIGSSPKVSELHELPRPPPDTFNTKPMRHVGPQKYSAPLVNREREISPTSRNMLSSNEGSPLLLPRLTVSRSFSIPSSSNRFIFHSGKLFPSQAAHMMDEAFATTTLTPPLSSSGLKLLNSRQL